VLLEFADHKYRREIRVQELHVPIAAAIHAVRIFYSACEIGFRALGALGVFAVTVNVTPVTFIELLTANRTGG
jgi:hypothetical protein